MAEATFAPGQKALLVAPPGRYELFCSAVGFAPEFGVSVTVNTGKLSSVACKPSALVKVCGEVLAAESGLPLAGASVQVASVGGKPPLVSPLGLQHVLRTFGATTDRQGRFCLFGQPNTFAPLLASAPGRATLCVPKVFFAADAPPERVLLAREATVEVDLPQPDRLFGSLPLWVFFRSFFEPEPLFSVQAASFPVVVSGLPAGLFEVEVAPGPKAKERVAVGFVRLEEGQAATLRGRWAKAQVRGKLHVAAVEGQCKVDFSHREDAIGFDADVSVEEGLASFTATFSYPGVHNVLFTCEKDSLSWDKAIGTIELSPGVSDQTLELPVELGLFRVALGDPCRERKCEVVAVTPGWVVGSGYGYCKGRTGEDGVFRCPVPMEEAVVVERNGQAGEEQVEMFLWEMEGLVLPRYVALPRWHTPQATAFWKVPSGVRLRLVAADAKGEVWPVTKPLVLRPGEARVLRLGATSP